MAPPGRRKPSLLIYLFTLLFFCSTAPAAAAVLGIDIGTSYIKAGIANPGSPIDVVLTKDSKRKEAATLAFKPSRASSDGGDVFPQRLYGGDAQALAARFPSDVFPNLKPLLGIRFDGEAAATYASRFPAVEVVGVPRGEDGKESTVGIKSKNIGAKAAAFMVEELLAMELKNIRANAEAVVAKGVSVNSAVITYPAFYTAQEKRALELAAGLAGFRVLSLVSDGTAVGVNYAMTRTFESVTDGAKPEYHVVYDMGAGSTTATVLKFQGRTIKTASKRNQTIQEVISLGTSFDKTLGGDGLNDLIVEKMIEELVQHKKAQSSGVRASDVKTNGKAMARIWKEAERVRQVLSANSAAYASMEGLYHDDLNFKYSLTRDRFEEMTLDHAARVKGPLVAALEAAGITLAELDSVILHGGAVRTPFIQKQLELAIGDAKKIKTNVNADEAAVLGATFQAAALSPGFRVKDIRVHDISGSSYTLKWTSDGKERQQKLFTPLSQVAAPKQVPLKVYEDTKFVFVEGRDTESLITQVEATNLTKSVSQLKDKHGCAPANISTVFQVRLSPLNGLPEIVSGSVSCTSDGTKDGGVLDGVKGLFGFGGKKEQVPLTDDELEEVDPAAMAPEPVDDPTSSASIVSAASPSEPGTADASAAASATKSAVATPSEVAISLSLKASPRGRSTPPEKSLPKIQQRLTDFDKSDRDRVARADASNELEAFAYRGKDYLGDTAFIGASSDKVRAKLAKDLTAASEWLYGDGENAKFSEIKDKLKQLKDQVDPVLKRIKETKNRPDAVKALEEGLDSMKGIVEMVEGSVKKAAEDAASSLSSASAAATEGVKSAVSSEIDDLEEDPYSSTSSAADAAETDSETPIMKPYEYTPEDLSALTTARDAARKWLDNKLAAQKKLGPYDDPAVLVSELEAKARQVQNDVQDILLKSIRAAEPKKAKGSKKPKTAKPKKSSKSSKATSTGSAESTTTTNAHTEL